jgi:hypothetical protein
MNLALLSHLDLFAPFQGLLRWLSLPKAQPVRRHQKAEERPEIAPKLIAAHAMGMGLNGANAAFRKPLRVVRVVEDGQGRNCVGRMVISGRMADVCAELDRLAARE